MIKFVLCIGIVFLCGYIGQINSRKYLKRLEFLEAAKEFVYTCDLDMLEEHLTLEEAIKRETENAKSCLKNVLENCYKRLSEQPNMQFEELWQQVISEEEKQNDHIASLSEQEKRLVLATGRRLVSDTTEPKSKYILLDEYERTIAALREILPNRLKLINSLSLLAGFLIAILII